MSNPSILYVTDLHYEAKGRVYGDEDRYLVARLADEFAITTCDPRHAADRLAGADVVVVRNSGPVIHYREAYDAFRARATELGTVVYNPLSGRGDMVGKQYLVALFAAGHPVIPTVDRRDDVHRLGPAEVFVVKPKLGSDSIGLRVLTAAELAVAVLDDELVQPLVVFDHEMSFYFVDHELQHTLHAPDPSRRWELVPWTPSATDRAFAQQFVDWNAIDHGIQRIDACRRSSDGELLLMEVEDLNPYLSLEVLDVDEQERFVDRMADSIRALLAR